VTVMTHTAGRADSVRQLYDSIQRGYPGTQVLGSDDTGSGAAAAQPAFGPQMKWVTVPKDCGLSLARNRLVAAAKTPYVQLLDDDFTVEEGSHLDLLLAQLHLSRYDIVSPVVPYDIKTFTNFRGFIDTSRGSLELKPGSYGRNGYGCAVVDFVPNVFMGKRAALAAVQWDDDLKLGEHENFFLRAKQAGLRIASCDHIAVYHHQQPWWDQGLAKDEREQQYFKRRQRVFEYMKRSIVKHGLKKLISFGTTQVTAD
jgi:GT2 family glycosyltransferase